MDIRSMKSKTLAKATYQSSMSQQIDNNSLSEADFNGGCVVISDGRVSPKKKL